MKFQKKNAKDFKINKKAGQNWEHTNIINYQQVSNNIQL